MLERLTRQGVTNRLELALVDRGVSAAAARALGRDHALRSAESGGTTRSRSSSHPAHLAKSFENTTSSATGWLQVACIATTLRHLSRERASRRSQPDHGTGANRAERGRSGCPYPAGRSLRISVTTCSGAVSCRSCGPSITTCRELGESRSQ